MAALQRSPLLEGIDWQHPDKIFGNVQKWAEKQSAGMEVAIATLAGGAQGAFLGGMMGALSNFNPPGGDATPGGNSAMKSQLAALNQGPWIQARNFAVITGVNAGLQVAIKKIRGKDDIYTTMMAAFGGGAAFSLVSGVSPAGNKLVAAFTTGVMFALFQGAFSKLGQTFGGGASKAEDPNYLKGKHLLTTLGLEPYEKNLRKGKLTDHTIMLWNDSALQEVKIPPGPRLLILHHIDRYRHILKPGMPIPGPMPSLPPKVPAAKQ